MERKLFIDPATIRFQTGTYMLLWFTNPDKVRHAAEPAENGLCSQFYNSLEEAEQSAALLTGGRIILMCTMQNPVPDSNVYWSAIKIYGDSMDFKELTLLPEHLRNKFLKQQDNL